MFAKTSGLFGLLLLLHGCTAATDFSWIREGQYFPNDVTDYLGINLVTLCPYELQSESGSPDDIVPPKMALRPSAEAMKQCKQLPVTEFVEYVNHECPVKDVTFIHHVSHTGSTLLGSMLDTVPGVRAWLEFPFLNKVAQFTRKTERQSDALLRSFGCTIPGAPAVDHLVVKLSSKLSQQIDNFRATFPTAKWIQLFRQPEHVLASLCSKWIEKEAEFHAGDTDSKMLPCVVSGKAATPAEAAKHVSLIMTAAAHNLMESFLEDGGQKGLLVEYDDLVRDSTALESILSYIGVEATQENVDRALTLKPVNVKRYSHNSLGKVVEDDSREKEAKIEQSPTLRPLAAQLQSVYQTLRELAQTQFSALTTPKHLQPELFSLEEVFTQWPPKDIRTPKIHETPHSTVTVVDFSSSNEGDEDYQAMWASMLEMQAADVPFVVRGLDQMDKLQSLWTRQYLTDKLGVEKSVKASTSQDDHHMYISGSNIKKVEKSPVENAKVTYGELLEMQASQQQEHSSTAQESSLTTYGLMDASRNKFMKKDLQPIMKALAWNEALQSVWQCKIGVPGIINEAHFDGPRNLVAMLQGAKRWVISPPSEALKGMELAQKGPFFRHATFDWADPTSWPRLRSAKGVNVVLREGDVLSLPAGWVHYIISLDQVGKPDGMAPGANMQCNSWHGSSVKGSMAMEKAMPLGAGAGVVLDTCQQAERECNHLTSQCMIDQKACADPREFHECYEQVSIANAGQCENVEDLKAFYAMQCQFNHRNQPEKLETCPPIHSTVMAKLSAPARHPQEKELVAQLSSAAKGSAKRRKLQQAIVKGRQQPATFLQHTARRLHEISCFDGNNEGYTPGLEMCHTQPWTASMFDNEHKEYICEIKRSRYGWCPDWTWTNELGIKWSFAIQTGTHASAGGPNMEGSFRSANGARLGQFDFHLDYDLEDFNLDMEWSGVSRAEVGNHLLKGACAQDYLLYDHADQGSDIDADKTFACRDYARGTFDIEQGYQNDRWSLEFVTDYIGYAGVDVIDNDGYENPQVVFGLWDMQDDDNYLNDHQDSMFDVTYDPQYTLYPTDSDRHPYFDSDARPLLLDSDSSDSGFWMDFFTKDENDLVDMMKRVPRLNMPFAVPGRAKFIQMGLTTDDEPYGWDEFNWDGYHDAVHDGNNDEDIDEQVDASERPYHSWDAQFLKHAQPIWRIVIRQQPNSEPTPSPTRTYRPASVELALTKSSLPGGGECDSLEYRTWVENAVFPILASLTLVDAASFEVHCDTQFAPNQAANEKAIVYFYITHGTDGYHTTHDIEDMQEDSQSALCQYPFPFACNTAYTATAAEKAQQDQETAEERHQKNTWMGFSIFSIVVMALVFAVVVYCCVKRRKKSNVHTKQSLGSGMAPGESYALPRAKALPSVAK